MGLDDRSYEVRSGDRTYRRNRTHLKPTNEPPDKPTSPYAQSLSKTALPTSPGIPIKAASPEKMKQPTLPQVSVPSKTIPPEVPIS